MKVLHKKPWFWAIFKLFMDIDWEINVMTFGDTIYAKEPLREDVLIHEQVHIKQQKGSKLYGVWMCFWYLLLPKFRYKLEVEACKEQMKWVKDKVDFKIYRALYEQQIYHLHEVINKKIPRSQIVIDFPYSEL